MTVLGRFRGNMRDEVSHLSDLLRTLLAGGDPDAAPYRYSIPRVLAGGNLAALATGVMTSTGMYFRKGDLVTSLSFLSGATAAGTPTNQFAALYSADATPALLGQSADLLTAAWAADTVKTFTLATPVTIPKDGLYYAAVNVTATTVPTLAGLATRAAAAGAVGVGDKVLSRTSGSGLTGTAPATITGGTTVANVPLVIAA